MKLTKQFVEKLFRNLENGHQDQFFSQVAPNVLWEVMGTHPLAGVYHGKQEFLDHTFVRLKKLLKGGPVLKVSNILIAEDTPIVIVEMVQLSYSINGRPFNNTYCWLVKFENEVIVHVRAYLDSALVQALVNENPIEAK
ncbi:MAG: ketosteroid isomerase [Alphaproteobacteria bacterium]|nr:ketosteroid isomerase [Alphaproteobacteria bacterium]